MKKTTLLLIALLCATLASAQQKVTLRQCVESALSHNRALQNASLDILAANEQSKEAYTKYYPQISANVMAFQAFDKMIKADGTIPMEVAAISQALAPYAGMPYSISEMNSTYSATLSVIEPIYAGGQIHTANNLARVQTDVKQLQLQLKERDIEQKVTENYWKIASIKYNLSTLDAAQKQVDTLYKHVEQYVNAGVTNRNDLLKVKLRQQELASSRLRLDNARTVLLLLLAQQTGLTHTPIDIDESVSIDDTPSPSGAYKTPSQAAGNRSELLLAQKAIEAQQLQIKLERGKNLPTVAVGLIGYNAGIGGLSTTVRNAMKTNYTNAMLNATVSVPISSWWGGSKAIRRQKIALQQKQNSLIDTQEQLEVDILTAWSNLTEAYKQIDIARTSVEQATENLRLSHDQYNAGTETLTNLLDAETLHRQAQNTLSDALATYQSRLAIYRLKTR